MKKAFIFLAFLALCFVSAQAKEAIKIGVITPMSGSFAALKELAVIIDKRTQELNANSKNLFEYKLVFEDSQFDPKTSHMAAMKLLRADKVDALFVIAALSVKVAVPLVNQYCVPQLALASDDPSFGRWTFIYFTTASDTATLALNAAKVLGYKSYAVMGQRQEAGLLMVAALKKATKTLGLENKGEFLWNPGDLKDFRGYLLKVREAKADCIVFFPTPPDPDIFFRQMKELGIETPVIGTETYAMVEDKKWVEGKWLSGCPPMKPEMIAKLKTYGVDPKLTYDPYAYDLPGIMIQSVEAAGKANAGQKPTSAQIRDALAGIKTIETSFGAVQQDSNGTFHPAPVLVYYEKGIGREVTLEELKKLKGVK